MRFATYRHPGATDDRVGVAVGGELFALTPGTTLVTLLAGGAPMLEAAGGAALVEPAEVVPVDAVRLRAPVPAPPSVRDFLAFEAHLRNARGRVDPDWYELPVFYFSNPAAVLGPHDDVAVAPGSEAWDYELECAAVVGPGGSDLSVDGAAGHIAGYCVLCDFSARDLQRREVRLGLGPAKGKDGATSLGPFLVTPDELAPAGSAGPLDRHMTASVNGEVLGGGRLGDMYWSFPQLLAYASRGTTLRPGDVIGSGTVGTGCLLELRTLAADDGPRWLRPGDVVEVGIEGIGTLRHRIVAGRPPRPLR